MLEMIKGFWKEHKGGLITTVVGGLILAVLLSQKLQGLVAQSLNAIQIKVTLPFYWLLIIVALVILVMRILIWRASKKPYDMDVIEEFVWEQNPPTYTGENGLTLLCPCCLRKIDIRGEHQRKFTCSCGFEKNTNIIYSELKEGARKEFERRARIGDSVNAARRLKPILKLARTKTNKFETKLEENG